MEEEYQKKVNKVLILAILSLVGFLFALFNYHITSLMGNEEDAIVIRVGRNDNINRAIEDLSNKGGGTVILEGGKYSLKHNGGPIELLSNVTLKGQGAGTIIINDIDESNAIVAQGKILSEVRLRNNLSCGPSAAKAPFIVEVEDASGFSSGDDIEISDGVFSEYNVILSTNTEQKTIELLDRPSNTYKVDKHSVVRKVDIVKNIEISNINLSQIGNSGHAIFLDYVQDARITSNSITGQLATGHSIYLGNCKIVQVANNKIKFGGHGVSIGPFTSSTIISGNTFDNCWTGIALNGHRNLIDSNLIKGSGNQHDSGDGITIGGYANSNIIKGNSVDSGNCYGIWITGDYPTNNVIMGNIIRANIAAGIYVNKGENNILTSNSIQNNSHGVLLQDANNTVVQNNTIDSNEGAGIFVYENSNNNTVSGNIVVNNGNSDWVLANDINLVDADNSIVQKNTITKEIFISGHGSNLNVEDNLEN